jgi:hypothetical protein
MDAWRTSCPKFPIWEDALSDHLIRVAGVDGGYSRQLVELTTEGRTLLERFG